MRWRKNAVISSDPWKVNADPDRQVGSRSDRIIPEIWISANPVDSCCTVETGVSKGTHKGRPYGYLSRRGEENCTVDVQFTALGALARGENYTVDV